MVMAAMGLGHPNRPRRPFSILVYRLPAAR